MDSLPDWLTPLLDAEAMRGVDRWAIEERGVPSLELMERAGAGVARIVERVVPDGPAVVVCGKGNNGGDGLVVARLLREAGRNVTVVCATPPGDFAGDARVNFERLPGEAPIELTEDRARAEGELAAAGVIVDALLGTGFEGEPRGAVGEAIEAVNAARAPGAPGTAVVSVDVPSGVDASTGVASGAAVRATVTATFHAGKPGLWVAPGKTHAGTVETIEIGIPRGWPGATPIGLIDPSIFELLPRRWASSTKFVSGHVLIAGGSRGLTGAPRMAAHAAMRAGAGYVTAFVGESLQPILATAGPAELMTRGLPDDGDGGLTVAGVESVLEASERGGALALGPGLGRAGSAVEF
ncbi:MAG: NAD(P)H-hydrate epimerase, partial [Solirubrobacteraceae bacterium]